MEFACASSVSFVLPIFAVVSLGLASFVYLARAAIKDETAAAAAVAAANQPRANQSFPLIAIVTSAWSGIMSYISTPAAAAAPTDQEADVTAAAAAAGGGGGRSGGGAFRVPPPLNPPPQLELVSLSFFDMFISCPLSVLAALLSCIAAAGFYKHGDVNLAVAIIAIRLVVLFTAIFLVRFSLILYSIQPKSPPNYRYSLWTVVSLLVTFDPTFVRFLPLQASKFNTSHAGIPSLLMFKLSISVQMLASIVTCIISTFGFHRCGYFIAAFVFSLAALLRSLSLLTGTITSSSFELPKLLVNSFLGFSKHTASTTAGEIGEREDIPPAADGI